MGHDKYILYTGSLNEKADVVLLQNSDINKASRPPLHLPEESIISIFESGEQSVKIIIKDIHDLKILIEVIEENKTLK